MSLRLDLTVAAVAEHEGRFLFVQERASRRVVLNQPAGHVEPGESLIDAVVRETLEETGRAFRPEAVLGFYLWQAPAGRAVLRVAFAGEAGPADAARPLDRSILRAVWLGCDELRARHAEHRSPLVRRCVEDYLRGVRYPLGILSHVALDGSLLPLAAV